MFPSSAVQISRLCAITWGFHGDSDMSAWHYHLGPWWQLVPAAAKDCQCSWSYHSQDPYCHQIYKDICIHKDILPLALYGSERWAAAKTTSILMSFSSTGVLAVFYAWAALEDDMWLWSCCSQDLRWFLWLILPPKAAQMTRIGIDNLDHVGDWGSGCYQSHEDPCGLQCYQGVVA